MKKKALLGIPSKTGKERRLRRKGIKIKAGNVVVKIYHDNEAGDRKPWRVVWSDATGKTQREMFDGIDEARTFAETVASDLNNGERPYTKEQIKTATMDAAKLNGYEDRLRPLGRSVEQIVLDVLAAWGILPGWTISQMAAEIRNRHATIKQYMLVHEAAEKSIAHLESGFKRQYSKSYKSQHKKYCREFAAAFTGRRIDLVNPEEVLRFINGYRVQPTYKHKQKGQTPEKDGLLPADPKTKDSVYNCLRRLFNHARDVLAALPAEERTAAERVERPQVPRNTPEVYVARDAIAILTGLPDQEMLLYAAVQLYAGLRGCEALRLTAGDFSKDENGAYSTIIVRYGKKSPHGNGDYRKRPAPITKPLAALLAQIQLPKGRLFCRYRIAAYLTEYARLAGVTWKHDALRHTFVSYRLLDVKNRDQVAHEAGHTVAVQLDHYDGLVNPADVKPFWEHRQDVTKLPWHAEIPDVKTLIRRVAEMNADTANKGKTSEGPLV